MNKSEDELNASRARDLRAETRYHFAKANEAMDKMYQAEEDDNVEAYNKWLAAMRLEDQKLLDTSSEYESLRDYLEAKIWKGLIKIKNFNLLYEKSTASSIWDHLTFRVKH